MIEAAAARAWLAWSEHIELCVVAFWFAARVECVPAHACASCSVLAFLLGSSCLL